MSRTVTSTAGPNRPGPPTSDFHGAPGPREAARRASLELLIFGNAVFLKQGSPALGEPRPYGPLVGAALPVAPLDRVSPALSGCRSAGPTDAHRFATSTRIRTCARSWAHAPPSSRASKNLTLLKKLLNRRTPTPEAHVASGPNQGRSSNLTGPLLPRVPCRFRNRRT